MPEIPVPIPALKALMQFAIVGGIFTLVIEWLLPRR